jgi:putative GTP pyrophosphokinase
MNDIISEYNENLKIIEKNAKNTYELINKLINDEKVHNFGFRIKKLDSLEKKIKDKKNYNKLEDITDIIGFRIITYLNSDVDKIFKIISDNFIIDDINTIDKRNKKYNEFGYKSLHVIFSYKKERATLPEYDYCNKYKYELQIRTILQHSWAEIEHDLGYKSDLQIPDEYKRTFYKISMLLEYADDEFEKITHQIKKYREELKDNINNNNLNILLNKESLSSYITKSIEIKYINDEIIKLGYRISDSEGFSIFYPIDELIYVGINNIEELHDNIIRFKKVIPKCLDAFMKSYYQNDMDKIFSGWFDAIVSIHYLIYILVSRKDDGFIENFIIKYIKENSIKKHLESIKQILIEENL